MVRRRKGGTCRGEERRGAGGGGGGALTSVLRGELPHGCGKASVELVLAGDEGLADGLLPEAEHTGVAPHLVHEGLKQDPFAQIVLLLCLLHRLYRWTHPQRALDSWLRTLRSGPRRRQHWRWGQRSGGRKGQRHRAAAGSSLLSVFSCVFSFFSPCVVRFCWF